MKVCGADESPRAQCYGQGTSSCPRLSQDPSYLSPFPSPTTSHTLYPCTGVTTKGSEGPSCCCLEGIQTYVLVLTVQVEPHSISPFPSHGAQKPLHSSHQDQLSGETWANTSAEATHSMRLMQRRSDNSCCHVGKWMKPLGVVFILGHGRKGSSKKY